ncbi:hypothetical protein Bmyc01_45170 [Bacillus mycoides]|nr:hypothetical protein Bmyc01_45170 [Bacillus mycoides]
MNNLNFLCEQFAKIFNGKSNINQGVCSVSLRRNINVFVQGRPSTSVIPVGISFESLDQNGNALNLGEIAILQEEIPLFIQSIVQQGIIVSALHIQSVEPPLSFAKKLANSFSVLSSYPITDNGG